jgi:predicted DNA-binding protein (MmcQ/YjbR family)
MYVDSDPLIGRLREICLALPGVFEKEAWGECTFRVTGGSMFAMTDNHHHGAKHIAVWVKAPVEAQEILVAADSKKFFVPPYVGAKGWIGVRLDYKVDWEEVAAIVKDGYELSAPKRQRPAAKAGASATVGRAPKKHPARANGPAPKSAPRAKRSSAVQRSPRR